jgi:hypothetical protein
MYVWFVRIDASLAAGLSVEPHAIIGAPYPQVIGKSGDGPGRGYFRAVALAHAPRRDRRAGVLKRCHVKTNRKAARWQAV